MRARNIKNQNQAPTSMSNKMSIIAKDSNMNLTSQISTALRKKLDRIDHLENMIDIT